MGNREFHRDNAGEYISLNGEIMRSVEYLDGVDDAAYWEHGIAYEVIRVIGGAPMFFGDHLARLNASLSELNADVTADAKTLRARIAELLAANGVRDCNVKIWAVRGSAGGLHCLMNINRSFYPPPEYYENGVPTGLYAYTRGNPNAKHVVAGFKERVQALMDEAKVFELILYDGEGRMTEGSRSNLFFARGGRLFTAPDDLILKGTIRKYVFAAAKNAGIEIVERPLTLGELGLPEHGSGGGAGSTPAAGAAAGVGAFLTGTSIGVLPIARIEGLALASAADPVVRAIRAEYEKIAKEGEDS